MYAGFFAVRDRGTDPVKFTIKSTPFKGRLESVFKRSQEIEEGEEVADVTRPGTAAPAAAKAGMPKSAGSGSARDSKIEGKTVEAAAGATTRGSGASGREFELGKAKGAAAAAKSAAGRDAAAVQGGAGSEIAGASGTQKPKRRREEVEEGEILSDDDEEPGELVISCSRRSPREIVDHYGRKKAKHAECEDSLPNGAANHTDSRQKEGADGPQALDSTTRRPSMEGANGKSKYKDRDQTGRDEDHISRISRAPTERSPRAEDRTGRFAQRGESSSRGGRSPRSQDSPPPRRGRSPGRQSPSRRPRSPLRPSPQRYRRSPARAPRDRLPCRSRDEQYGRARELSPRGDYSYRGSWRRRDDSDFRRDYRGRDPRVERRDSPNLATMQKSAGFRDRGYNLLEFVPPAVPDPAASARRRRSEQLAAQRRAQDERRRLEQQALEERRQNERRAREDEYEYAVRIFEEALHTKLLETLLQRNSLPYSSHQKAETKKDIRKQLQTKRLPFEKPVDRSRRGC